MMSFIKFNLFLKNMQKFVGFSVAFLLIFPPLDAQADGNSSPWFKPERDLYTSTTTTLVVAGVVLLLVLIPVSTTGAVTEGENQREKKQEGEELLDQYREQSLWLYLLDNEVGVSDALALGAGAPLHDLAAIMGVEDAARPAWFKSLRVGRRALIPLIHAAARDQRGAAALRHQLGAAHAQSLAAR